MQLCMINFNRIKNSVNNTHLKVILYNYFITGFTILINLLLIPLLLSVLGKERFGVWQTILSIISIVSLLNFGLGNGLRNLITKLKVRGEKSSENSIGAAIGATFVRISKIVGFSSLILIPVTYFFLNPNFLFSNVNISGFEIKYSLLIFLFFFLINIILGLSNSISFGLQKSYLTGLRQFLYLLLCYIIIYVTSRFVKINLINVSLIFGFIQSLTFLFFIFYQNIKYNLSITFFENFDLKETSSLSFKFFLAQGLTLIFLSIDNFVISSILGPNDTAEYSIVNKIYFTIISIFSVLLIHFWNSVTEAFEKKELKWIFSTLKILYVVAFIFFLISLGIAFFQKSIINLWLGKNSFHISSSTFYLFAIYTFFHCLNAIFVNIQNGLGYLKIQIYSMIFMLLLYGLGCYFIDIKHHGYIAIILLKLVIMGFLALINATILFKLK